MSSPRENTLQHLKGTFHQFAPAIRDTISLVSEPPTRQKERQPKEINLYLAEPKAYTDKCMKFCGFNFFVDKRVYVPNPETELMVNFAINFIIENKLEEGLFVDIGTGCGNIAITLAKHFPKAKIIAADISIDALNVAKINLKNHGVKNIELRQSNLVSNITEQPDLIIGNLPWGDDDHLLQTNTKEGLSFMPHVAIFAPDGIIGTYVRLVEQIIAQKWHTNLIVETGMLEHSLVKKHLPSNIFMRYERIPHEKFNYSVTNICF